MTDKQRLQLLDLLWNFMKPEPTQRRQDANGKWHFVRRAPGDERVQTAYGTKTRTGLVACIESILEPESHPGFHLVKSEVVPYEGIEGLSTRVETWEPDNQ